MPKVIVEFDLPEGQAIPDPLSIVQLTSPDWHCDWWHISDVQDASGNEDLTDEEAREVLELMAKYADCNIGINWDSIDVWADIVRKERPPVECECCHEEFDREDLIEYQGKMICGDCELDLKEKENA